MGDAILMTDWNTVFTATLHFIYSIEIVDMTHKQMMNWTQLLTRTFLTKQGKEPIIIWL